MAAPPSVMFMAMLCLCPVRGGGAPPSQEQQRADLRLLEALFGAAKLANVSTGTISVDHPLDSGAATFRRIQELGAYWAEIRSPEDGARLPPVTQVKVRAAHRDLILWLSLRQPKLTHLIDRLKRQLWSRLGLTTHPDQWPSDLNRRLRAQPVHRCAGIEGCDAWHAQAAWPALEMAVRRLEAALPLIAPEAFALFSPAAQRAYEEPEGLQREGSWRAVDVVPLREVADGPPELADAGLRCALGEGAPATCAALASFAVDMVALEHRAVRRELGPHPWLLEARYHLMLPGTTVMLHTATNNQRLKVHCGLRNPGKVALRISNYTMPWAEGRCMVIDDSFEHQIAFEPGQQARAILQLKISHPDLSSSPLQMHGVELVREDGSATPALKRHRELRAAQLEQAPQPEGREDLPGGRRKKGPPKKKNNPTDEL